MGKLTFTGAVKSALVCPSQGLELRWRTARPSSEMRRRKSGSAQCGDRFSLDRTRSFEVSGGRRPDGGTPRWTHTTPSSCVSSVVTAKVLNVGHQHFGFVHIRPSFLHVRTSDVLNVLVIQYGFHRLDGGER